MGNYHQFRGKFCIEFVRRVRPLGRSRRARRSAREGREAKSPNDPPLNCERENFRSIGLRLKL
jgi:hypothetical protein